MPAHRRHTLRKPEASAGSPLGTAIGVKIERFRPRDRRLAHKILETRFLPSATSGGRGALTLTPMPGPPAPPEHDHRNGGLIHPGALIVLLHVDLELSLSAL